MRRRTQPSTRVLSDGTAVQNRLLGALPTIEYNRLVPDLRLRSTGIGETLHQHGTRINHVYFPNAGVYSVTNRMRNGGLVEVATVGREGMLGVGVFLGDRSGSGRTLNQVPDGRVVALAVGPFLREAGNGGTLRQLMELYAQATILQTMQCTACNALHDVSQRCCRWLLQIHDRVDGDDFPLKQEFLAIMLGVRRPTVTIVLRALQRNGLIANRYGHMRVLKRNRLEAASCECYAEICGHFARLGL
jgi:CRP-like cAMP-binding protein